MFPLKENINPTHPRAFMYHSPKCYSELSALRQTRRHFPIKLIPSRAFNEALPRAELHPLDILSRYTFLSLLLEPTTHCHWPVPSLSSLTATGHLGTGLLYKPRSFVLGSLSLMMEAVRTSETSVDNYFTRQYIPGIPGISLKGLWKTTRNLSYDSRSVDWDWTWYLLNTEQDR
jgi:hypothetical protein